MNGLLNHLLSGGAFSNRVADRLHGAVWAHRLSGGRADAAEMSLLETIDLEGRVALDVGAHAGNWSHNLSRRVGAAGAVIAYEALPHYGRALSLAMKFSRVKNVRVRNVAVGDEEKTIGLRWRTDDKKLLTGRTHIDPKAQNSSGTVQVPMVSLDHDLERLGIRVSDVAFMKIDVEGAELEVLRGAANLLGMSHPAVYLEAEPQWLGRFGHSVSDVFEEMSGRGYGSHLVTKSGILAVDVDSYLNQYSLPGGSNNVLFLHTATK